MAIEELDKTLIWKTFSQAVGAELRENTTIRGVSGLDHAVQAIAVDDKTNRVIIVSAEASPRMAALMQVDVQATIPGSKVLVARPVAVDISNLARKMLEPFGISYIELARAKAYLDNLKDNKMSEGDVKTFIESPAKNALDNMLSVFSRVELPAMDQIMSIVMQAGILPWKEIGQIFNETAVSGTLDLKALMANDSIEADLHVGVCPVPLYEFSDSDFEAFLKRGKVDEAREVLKSLGVYQYFFPAADQVALGLIEQGVSVQSSIVNVTQQSPVLGHPFGEIEIVKSPTDLIDMLDQLKGLGYVAEGEQGYEISEKGQVVRSTVKYRPREGFITKLLNRMSFSASVTPKDFM